MIDTLDLFSGIGGFSLGLEATGGFSTKAFCEISRPCQHLLKTHWPEVPCFDDITKLRGRDVGPVRAICGGFPCQDISLAGQGAGLAGERSGLWREYDRLIGELRPEFVIVENVAALLGRGFGTVAGDLAARGYDLWWDCIPAAAVGAPHRRDRLWVVAYARGQQHEGFGDALRRAVAEELSAPDALGVGTRCGWEGSQQEPAQDAGILAHANIEGLQGRDGRGVQERPGQRAPRASGPLARASKGVGLADAHRKYVNRARQAGSGWRRQPADGRWWLSEPNVGRVADGVPARVDRLHGLGNAVVPLIPYKIGRAILRAMT